MADTVILTSDILAIVDLCLAIDTTPPRHTRTHEARVRRFGTVPCEQWVSPLCAFVWKETGWVCTFVQACARLARMIVGLAASATEARCAGAGIAVSMGDRVIADAIVLTRTEKIAGGAGSPTITADVGGARARRWSECMGDARN